MEGPPLGSGGEDITWPDQVAPRGRKASSTRKIKPQTSNLWWAPLVLQRGGDRFGLAQPRVACVAGGRAGHQVGSLGNTSHMTPYGGVGLAPSYSGLVGQGRPDASSVPSTNTVTSPTSRSSSVGCRRWSAASNSDTPPGYVARAWFRYGAVSPGQRVLRACSRSGALLRRDMADLFARGRCDRLDSRHSIQCP